MRGNSLERDIQHLHLLKQYLVLRCPSVFTLKMRAKEMGVDFANAWRSILYAGHLYNATRREELFPKARKDMELMITLQGTEKSSLGTDHLA